jgi:tripartite-type tricarboxylate transporter receptor subunit TctC
MNMIARTAMLAAARSPDNDSSSMPPGGMMPASFQKQTDTKLNFVPYRGITPALQDLVGAQIDLMFGAPDGMALVRTGNIRAYAVTSETRLTQAPEVPTFVEMGLPRMTFSGWLGLFAPKGTPTEIISKLNAAVVQALADPAAHSRATDLGYEIFPREQQTPEVLGALVKADVEKWWPLIKEFGIKAE